ncbi:hypothetical protein [Methanolobus sp. WCC5]|uniref:hypothetical protein n=1 Tax=Methanolobus sp. WCC5 TaxID=3125785 RepID=UPI0032496A5E
MKYVEKLKILENVFVSKDSTLFVFLLLIAINIVIRLPMTYHAVGVDTFYIQTLSSSISTFGRAEWLIHPGSFFGIYPYSYPSVQPYLLSIISQALGISIEKSIFIFSLFLGQISLFSAYLLAKEFIDEDVYCLIAAFLFSISPNLIRFTYWQSSTRGLFLAMLPFFILLILRFGNKLKSQDLLLVILSLVFLFATHRTSWFLVIIISAFVISFLVYYIGSVLSYLAPLNAHTYRMFIVLFLSFSMFLLQFTKLSIFDMNTYYSVGLFVSGTDSLSQSINLFIDYFGKIGILVIFSMIGLIGVSSKRDINFNEVFLIFSFMMLLPLMGLKNYSPLIMAPFLLILGILGIQVVVKNLSTSCKWGNSLTGVLIFLCIFSSIFLTLFMIGHWGINEDSISDEMMVSTSFLQSKSTGTIVANNGFLANVITAYSGIPALPLGGSYAIPYPPNQIAYGFVNLDEISTRPLSFSEISPSTDTFYTLTRAPNAKSEWVEIMENSYLDDSSKYMLDNYNANIVIEQKNDKMYFYWSWRYSSMLVSLHDSGNMIYSSGNFNCFNLPNS